MGEDGQYSALTLTGGMIMYFRHDSLMLRQEYVPGGEMVCGVAINPSPPPQGAARGWGRKHYVKSLALAWEASDTVVNERGLAKTSMPPLIDMHHDRVSKAMREGEWSET
jgi:hypothetical protein